MRVDDHFVRLYNLEPEAAGLKTCRKYGRSIRVLRSHEELDPKAESDSE